MVFLIFTDYGYLCTMQADDEFALLNILNLHFPFLSMRTRFVEDNQFNKVYLKFDVTK